MVTLEMSDEDAAVLRRHLEGTLSDFRVEVSDTHRMEYRRMLQQEREALERVVDALAAVTEPV